MNSTRLLSPSSLMLSMPRRLITPSPWNPCNECRSLDKSSAMQAFRSIILAWNEFIKSELLQHMTLLNPAYSTLKLVIYEYLQHTSCITAITQKRCWQYSAMCPGDVSSRGETLTKCGSVSVFIVYTDVSLQWNVTSLNVQQTPLKVNLLIRQALKLCFGCHAQETKSSTQVPHLSCASSVA